MRRTDFPADHSAPFDHEFETESEMTQEFWGPSAGWQPRDTTSSRRLPRVDDTGSLRAIRDGVAAFRPQRVALRDPSGEMRRTRSHGVQRPIEPTLSDRRAEASIGDLAAGHFDERPAGRSRATADDIELIPTTPVVERLGLGGVDPLLARLGALVLVGVLLVPIALTLRASSDTPDSVQIEAPDEAGSAAGAASVTDVNDGGATADAAATTGVSESADVADSTSGATDAGSDAVAGADVAATRSSATESSAATADGASADESATSTDVAVGDVAQSVDTGIDEPATAEAPAERIVPACPQTYAAAAGDSWYRIADAAGISPNALMAENRATADTVIMPGNDICLPAGATVPSPPPAPDASETPSPATTTTDAPSTTSAPTTTDAPSSPGRDATVDEIKDLIRAAFPESEWETAFMIVQRESRFDPAAYNGWCCYGLFQIYWNVHRSWLDDYGIDSSNDLLDPVLNVRAAKAIWERSGNSWTPWSTYDG